MKTFVINVKEETVKRFSVGNLGKFINSEDFEDIVLGYQMVKGRTGNLESFSSFKKELGL